jgi:hypothetical protein
MNNVPFTIVENDRSEFALKLDDITGFPGLIFAISVIDSIDDEPDENGNVSMKVSYEVLDQGTSDLTGREDELGFIVGKVLEHILKSAMDEVDSKEKPVIE